jgi:tetratricopeptide (TPR) repeat protein
MALGGLTATSPAPTFRLACAATAGLGDLPNEGSSMHIVSENFDTQALLQAAAEENLTEDNLAESSEQACLEAAAALHQASRLEAAEAVYKRVLENRPDSYEALLGLGYLARDRGNRSDALACFEAAHAAKPSKTRPKLEAALELRKLNRLDEAEALYKSILEKRPKRTRAIAGLGQVALARDNLRAALAWYQAAVASSPESDDLKLKVASLLRKLSRLNEARQVYTDILTRNPGHDIARTRLQALGKPTKSSLPPMEASWLKRQTFMLADEWGRNLEALGIPAFGLSLLTLAQDFAYGASEEVKPDCILLRRNQQIKILPLVSDWEAYDRVLEREAAAMPPASILGYVPEERIKGWATRVGMVESHREYVYHRETVAQMAGSLYSQYRREIRLLLKAGAHVEPIGPGNIDRVLACNDRWFAGKAARGRKTYYRGRTLWTFDNLPFLEQLGVRHLAAILDDDVVGYAVASHIGSSWSIFTFRRGDREVRGVMPFLVSEIAKLYPDRQWINDGPAVRKPGLAWVKERLTANASEKQMKLGWIKL